MLAYTHDDNLSEVDEEEEPISSHGAYVNRAVGLQMTACMTPQMKKAAMAGISRCSWLYQGSMLHAARAATADVSAVDWNYDKVMVHKLHQVMRSRQLSKVFPPPAVQLQCLTGSL